MNSGYSSSSATQEVQAHLNLDEATRLISERAKRLVNQLVEDRGHDKPPFLPEEFARLQGIEKIEKADLGELSAVLLRFHDGYIIKLNKNHHTVRQNFSCAHEIGHILFSELKLAQYIKNIEYRSTYNPQDTSRIRTRAIERLCDIAAKELIMPEYIFSKYLSRFGVSVHSVELMANVFRTSIPATAIRIAEVSEEPCLALLWQSWTRARSRGLRQAWCVGPKGKTEDKTYSTSLNTYVRSPSTLHKAYQDNTSVKSSRLFKIGNSVKRLPIESRGFGRDKTRYVISLALLDR